MDDKDRSELDKLRKNGWSWHGCGCDDHALSEEDKEQIVTEVLQALPNGDEVKY